MKTCVKCSLEKDTNDFYLRKSGRRESRCVACHRSEKKAYYLANRQRRIAAAGRWQKENREQYNANARRRRDKDIVNAREREAAYREENREQTNTRTRKWYQENIERERARARESSATYADRHPERITARNKAFYEANKEAERKRALDWSKANSGKVKIKKRRGRDAAYFATIKFKYGLTKEMFLRRLGEQNGLCKACGGINDGVRLHVDHEHVDGYERLGPIDKAMLVRGLLCTPCNTGIGLFRDDPNRLEQAIAYLKAHAGRGRE